MKKIFLSSIIICGLFLSSCSKKDDVVPTQSQSLTENNLKAATASGWVMQPTWYYTSQSSKTFSIGNLGLVVTGTNTGTAETIVTVQERDINNNPLVENSFRMVRNGNGGLSVIPQSSTKKIVVTTIRAGGSGTVVGSIIVNSKY